MHDVTRRRFLSWTGMAAATSLLGGGSALSVGEVLSAAPAADTAPVLLLVTLYGGNDGLNTVVPVSDPVYQQSRADLAYRPGEVLDLGGGFGLNPAMPRMHALWRAGQVGIVHAVGYPKPDRSHFRSMAIWQTASPETSLPTGWLGRWLDVSGDDPLRALSLETTAPPMLAGARSAGSTLLANGLQVPPALNAGAYPLLARPDPSDSVLEARAARSVGDLYTVAAAVNKALATPGRSAEQFDAQLTAIAALINAGVPTRVFSASMSGYDTHAAERGTQEMLLGGLDTALGRFVDATAAARRPIVTVVYSEFGRRVRANGTDGTDHGTAAPVFVIGRGVRPGFRGAPASLTDLDSGDLRAAVDFRDVYASVLEEVIGQDAAPVLAGWKGRLPLLR